MEKGVTQAKRLDYAERDLRDHAKSISVLMDSLVEVGKRIAAVEEANMSYKIYMAREEERDKSLQARLQGIEASLNGIRGGFNKLLWIIGSSVLIGFVAFVINGGIRLPPV